MWLFKSRKIITGSDAEIIAAYKRTGDKQLVGVLFERYAHLVYGVCFKYLKNKEVSRDATLTIFEKLFSDLKKYEVTNFSSWLHTVARNYCFATLKSTLNDTQAGTLENLADTRNEEKDDDDDLIKQHLPKLEKALHSINTEQQKCVRLFYLADKSYAEIAGITGYSLKEVKSYIQNGKRNLRIYLTKQQAK